MLFDDLKLEQEDIHLLRKYYRNDMSLSQTAADLHPHKNTIQDKLNRIREQTQLDLRAFQDAVLRYLAICIEARNSTNL